MVIEKTARKGEAGYSGKRPGKDLYYVCSEQNTNLATHEIKMAQDKMWKHRAHNAVCHRGMTAVAAAAAFCKSSQNSS